MDAGEQWGRALVSRMDARCRGEALDRNLRITINFHPDRPCRGAVDHVDGGHGGPMVIEAMADGVYRTQFETGTSNGSVSAHPGGDRWRWEQHLFGGVLEHAPVAWRPRYGALDHRHRPLGAAPRFGSAHLRLREHVLDRATFCFPDSSFQPTQFATARHFDLFRVASEHAARDAGPEDPEHDPLDGYIETHVHGPVLLARDVEALVLDPGHRGTPVEHAVARLGVPVEWHEGRVLTLDVLDQHRDYRGPEPVRLGRRIARGGRIDARIVGDAACTGGHPERPLKQLWHLVAQWGSPAPA